MIDSKETISFLNGLQRFGWRLGLKNIRELLRRIGNPEKQIAAIHIAGSNGKGSTAAFLESILRAANLKTGLYTSPHLVDFTERIRVNASIIPPSHFSRILTEIRPDVEELGCTYFETLTAIAFKYFHEQKVDIAVIEVGLGGKFDATNVINPLLSMITEIALEHTDHLGATITEIAAEKAGIIKKGAPCLALTQNTDVLHVFAKTCKSMNTRFICFDDVCKLASIEITESHSSASVQVLNGFSETIRIPLIGSHQLRNAAFAITAVDTCLPMFNINDNDIARGVNEVSWPARLQTIDLAPRVIVDVAHNPPAIKTILDTIRDVYKFGQLHVIIGVLKDKNYAEIARLVAGSADHVFVLTPDSERALKKELFAKEFQKVRCPFTMHDNLREAFIYAKKNAALTDMILVTGSHYVVGEFLQGK